jgi:hypothetical protein
MFVTPDLLREKNGEFRIPVRLIDENEVYCLVSLPRDTLEGQRVLKVRRERVKQAP